MFIFVIAVILALVGLIVLIGGALKRSTGDSDEVPRSVPIGIGIVMLLIAAGVFIFSATFQLNRGEAAVVKSFTGQVQKDPVTQAGIHTKAPWDSVIKFNTLNQTVTYINGANGDDSDNNGGTRTGPYITTQDQNGVTFNLSLTVRYSLDASKVVDIYSSFKDEENFKQTFVTQDVRSVTRKAPNQFTTIQMLTDQGAVENAIERDLVKKWKGTGVSVDSVALQEPQAPKNVTESYAKVAQAQNELQAAKIKAQQTVNAAQAQADANKILNSQPLSDKSLNQKYIDALGKGTTFVVPEGSTPLITTGK